MESTRIIKCVAGAGKTTYSLKYLASHQNGLYLAFTNSVVNDIASKGFLAKTIDSFFSSYIIYKFIHVIPIIKNGTTIEYIDKNNIPQYRLGVMTIHINPATGGISNQKKPTSFSISTEHKMLYEMRGGVKNLQNVKYIFGSDKLRLTDSLRKELSLYIINHYPKQLEEILSKRFSYIIIDEAQDLSDYKEKFAQLLSSSKIPTIILGDDNQNIMGGSGNWFELQKATSIKLGSLRSPESICKWIRENLSIEIYGVKGVGGQFKKITNAEIPQYDDGKRVLLYHANNSKNISNAISAWSGPKNTIKKAKGSTIDQDIVIIGNKMNKKNLYVALTRTKGNAYCVPTLQDK